MNATVETTTTLWPQSPMPQTRVTTWERQITTVRQLSSVRADLRTRFRSSGCDDADGDGYAVGDCILLAVDELASNALRHGAEPVHARVAATADGWLIDISDAATDQGPHPAIGRDPALGGMGLRLVAELTTGHGWSVVADRKHVWASVPSAMTDRISQAVCESRGIDHTGPDNPDDGAGADVRLPSFTGRPELIETEGQPTDSGPSPIPGGPGRWAALTGVLSPQRRALANARRAVERDQRAAAQRGEADRALTDAAASTMTPSVELI